jgi:small-conductance mechanosensitive channel
MLAGFIRVVVVLAVIIAFLHLTGKLKAVGTVLGAFAGLLLGWALQAPVSGVAAWGLITVKRPFRVGDRIAFPQLGLIGDVLDVGLMYTTLDRVGGTVGTEEAVGQNVLIPNAMLFGQVAINYTPQQQAAYCLDEIIIRLTFDSDWETAENILINAAREVTVHIIEKTGKEPFIRADIYDYGVNMRLRYMTLAMDRPRIGHEILKKIFLEFQRNPRVDFAIPYVYSYRKGIERGGSSITSRETVIEVSIDNIDDPELHVILSAEDERGVDELAERISKMGLLQPIVVRRSTGNRYELVAGRYRFLACKRLGWKVIPAVLRSGPGS